MKVIFDLDGCLSDDRHRRHLLPGKDARYHYHKVGYDYGPYHLRCNLDPVVERGLSRFSACVQAYGGADNILFVTGRPESVRAKTEKWIARELGCPVPASDRLLMRPDGDETSAAELKVDLLVDFGYAGNDFDLAFDDRQDVLAAYRDFGIKQTCLLDVDTNMSEQVKTPPRGLDR